MLKIPTHTTPPNGFAFKEAALPHSFVDLTWQGLVADVKKFRLAMGGDLFGGWTDRLMHDACLQNNWPCVESAPVVIPDGPLQIQGRKLWGELHAYANAYDGDPAAALHWLEAWRERIPHFSCKCRESFARIYNGFPPDFTSRESFVRWCEIVHDWTNRHIGKPLWNAAQFNSSPARNV